MNLLLFSTIIPTTHNLTHSVICDLSVKENYLVIEIAKPDVKHIRVLLFVNQVFE